MLGIQPGPTPTPTATATVARPEPGLARGKWEAPAWAFWVALAVIVAGVGLYAAGRMGMLGRIFKKAPAPEAAPMSKRGKRP